jgi:hypothetical protein
VRGILGRELPRCEAVGCLAMRQRSTEAWSNKAGKQ